MRRGSTSLFISILLSGVIFTSAEARGASDQELLAPDTPGTVVEPAPPIAPAGDVPLDPMFIDERCGDTICDVASESIWTCPLDCIEEICGDGMCDPVDPVETAGSCSADCESLGTDLCDGGSCYDTVVVGERCPIPADELIPSIEPTLISDSRNLFDVSNFSASILPADAGSLTGPFMGPEGSAEGVASDNALIEDASNDSAVNGGNEEPVSADSSSSSSSSASSEAADRALLSYNLTSWRAFSSLLKQGEGKKNRAFFPQTLGLALRTFARGLTDKSETPSELVLKDQFRNAGLLLNEIDPLLNRLLVTPSDAAGMRMKFYAALYYRGLAVAEELGLNIKYLLALRKTFPGFIAALPHFGSGDNKRYVDFDKDDDLKDMAKAINNRVKFVTNGKITDLIKWEELKGDYLAFFASAFSIEGKWRYPFVLNKEKAPFTSGGGEKLKVGYLERNATLGVLDLGQGFVSIELPIEGNTKQFVYLIGDFRTDGQGIAQPFDSTSELFPEWLLPNLIDHSRYTRTKVKIAVPAFSITDSHDMRKVVKDLGLGKLIEKTKNNYLNSDKESELGMFKNPHEVEITKWQSKAGLAFTPEGFSGYAAQLVIVGRGEVRTYRFDKPFLAIGVSDGAIVMLGYILAPNGC